MKTFNIPCTWSMSGMMIIEANTLKEAVDLAEKHEPLPDGEYMSDSFEVAYEALHHYNEEA